MHMCTVRPEIAQLNLTFATDLYCEFAFSE